ncbi:hypothetical protein GCM10009623_12460 [Nocardioides aestuarii]|uniref:Uncharacterized protein n=1 Tax=Nocardioides aestuarii TaxID=252231 RepID=A0ABW4TJ10_9ACTN
MSLRVLAAAVGVLGGGCWIARWAAGDPTWGDATHWAGLVLLAVALAVVGAGLVSRSALWLRVIVAIAFPALVWSVYAVVRGSGDAFALDGVVGAVAVVWSLVVLVLALRSRGGDGGEEVGPAKPPKPVKPVKRKPGSHAR